MSDEPDPNQALINQQDWNMSSQILGLDVGDVRVGIAIADITVGIAFPRATLKRSNYVAEKAILALIEENSISLVVVGLPLDVHGQRTPQCEKVEKFVRRLCARSQISIEYIDEHLTSVEASDLGAKGEGVDAAAAALILQDYLDKKRLP